METNCIYSAPDGNFSIFVGFFSRLSWLLFCKVFFDLNVGKMLQFQIRFAALRESYLDRIAIAYLSTMIHRDALWILELRNVMRNKMTKKFAIVLALFVISIVCCAGCIGPGDNEDPEIPDVPDVPDVPVTPVDPVDPVVPVEEYSVMFMLNYGDAGAYTAETVKAGETVSKPATPTRSGYTFKGWFTAAEGGVEYDFTQAVNADVTLYAQWKKKSSSSSGSSSSGGSSTPSTPSHEHSYNYVSNNDRTHTKSCVSGDDTVTEDCKFDAGVTEGLNTKYTCSLCSYSYSKLNDNVNLEEIPALEISQLPVEIENATQLIAFGKAVHNVGGLGDITANIVADIDLNGVEWTPITIATGTNLVTINGGDHTITNLTAPLFNRGFGGNTGIVINDLIIADSDIIGSDNLGSGAFIESPEAINPITLNNCHLTCSTVTGAGRTGGLIGWTAGYNNVNDGPVKTYITIQDCSVIGCEITAPNSVGGLYGHAGNNAWTYSTIKNCIVKDNILTSTDNGEWRVGVVVGTANVGEVTISGITESGNTLTQTGKTAPEGQSNLYGRFVPVTTGLMVIDGEYFVSNSDALEEALSLETEGIVVNLAADITLAGGTSTTYGGTNTQTITINGNGHKLTYSDSYRTHIKLTNPDGKLVLSNVKLYRETTNTNTHYHNNNMQFRCDVEMNDVEFNKGITLYGGITAVLNEVKIPKKTVGTYALFIFAGSEVTLDGCTITSATGIDGRGIKIVDEDMTGTIPSTKLSVSNTKFTTASKAAVLVGSKGGADIAWGTGNDISGVAKDSTNAVWVDEDYAAYYDKVTVTGCTMVQEGLFVVTDDNQDGCQDDFQEAISNGKKVISLPEGTYTLKNTAAAGKTLTIVGTEDTKISVTDGLTYAVGATVAFDGVTILSEPEGEGYTNGFADFKYATFNNCVINGTLGLDFSCEFNGCTFNVDGNYYNVWTWGAGTVTFNDCTFNCDGKALLVYANVLDNGNYHQTVNINGCTFNDLGDDTVTGKAAIEITNTYTPIRTYDVFITKTTVNGFAKTVPGAGDFNAAYGSVDGSNIGTNVWGNKCKLPNTQINVMIDGVDVY